MVCSNQNEGDSAEGQEFVDHVGEEGCFVFRRQNYYSCWEEAADVVIRLKLL